MRTAPTRRVRERTLLLLLPMLLAGCASAVNPLADAATATPDAPSMSADAASAPEAGATGSEGSCSISASNSTSCVEYGSGYPVAAVMTACAMSSATWSASPCPSAARVGRCLVTTGSNDGNPLSTTASFYAPITATEAMAVCQSGNGAFLAN